MVKIIPLLVIYNLKIANHTMKAAVEHLELARRIDFFFDDKLVSEKVIPAGGFLTDDDCISDIIEEYCKHNVGVYVDILKNHRDKLHLTSKVLSFVVENSGIKLLADVVVEKTKYYFSVRSEKTGDSFTSTFMAESFSEALEKVRIFNSTLAAVTSNSQDYINEFSNDKVLEWVSWE